MGARKKRSAVPKRARPSALCWQRQEQQFAVVHRPASSEYLGVAIQTHEPGKWVAFAFAASIPDVKGKTMREKAAAFFDNHAHDTIGEFASEGSAKRAGAKYARAWLAGETPPRCDCGPIEQGGAS